MNFLKTIVAASLMAASTSAFAADITGAGATAGPAQVAKSPADGYTLLLNTSAQAYSAVFAKGLPYDPLTDFIPIVPVSIRSVNLLRSSKFNGSPGGFEIISPRIVWMSRNITGS